MQETERPPEAEDATRIDRRAFIMRSSLGALGAGLVLGKFGSNLAHAALRPENQTGDSTTTPPLPAVGPGGMRYRTLGRTNLRVAEVSYGAIAVSDPAVIAFAIDQGVNYIDTARSYIGGQGEITVGKAIKGKRDKVYLVTKWNRRGGLSKQAIRKQTEESLRALQTDYVDILMCHGVSAPEHFHRDDVLETMMTLRKEGKTRFLGVSCHSGNLVELMKEVIDKGHYDVILCKYNFAGHPGFGDLVALAHKKNVGFVAMKTLGGAKREGIEAIPGQTFRQAALKWVLSNPGVSNLIVTMKTFDDVRELCAVAGQQFTKEDQEVLRRYLAQESHEMCRFCDTCAGACPYGVEISNILRYRMYFKYYGMEKHAMGLYGELLPAKTVVTCAGCSAPCEAVCPYGLAVRTKLHEAHELLMLA